jgi:hypothetical protein
MLRILNKRYSMITVVYILVLAATACNESDTVPTPVAVDLHTIVETAVAKAVPTLPVALTPNPALDLQATALAIFERTLEATTPTSDIQTPRPALTSSPSPTVAPSVDASSADSDVRREEIEGASLRVLDIEHRRALLLSNSFETLIRWNYDRIAFGQRREFGNLSDLLLELAMLQVPENLQPVKDGLLEVYRLESSAVHFNQDCIGYDLTELYFGGYELNCNWRRSLVNPAITALNVVSTLDEAENAERLHFPDAQSPWTAAQVMRRTVYKYWYGVLELSGTDTAQPRWQNLLAVKNSS